MSELTKEEKKAKRKEFFANVKSCLPFIGAGVVSTVIGSVLAYDAGKRKGRENSLFSPEVKLLTKLYSYDAMSEVQNKILDYAMKGDYATEFEDVETGEKKYITYTVSDEAPEWWHKDPNARYFDIREEVLAEQKD